MADPIHEAAARYRVRHAQIIHDTDKKAEQIRRDLGLPRDRRKWQDHPRIWNRIQSEAVTLLEQAREQALAELRAARADSRRLLYQSPVNYGAGINKVMADSGYRQAREIAMNLPMGESGLHLALQSARMAAVVGDDATLAALSLLAEERSGGRRGTAWDQIPAIWGASSNDYVRDKLALLQAADDAMAQLQAPARYTLPRLSPIAPEPEPEPSITGNGQVVPSEPTATP